MSISSSLSKLIRKLIKDYIAKPALEPNDLRRLAAAKTVLPLFVDMGGVFAINSSGDIISFPFSLNASGNMVAFPLDETDQPRVESDPRIRNIALFQGSKKYPELRDLIVKPDDARVCSGCGGSGIDPAAARLNVDNIVCYCGGLGWIP